MIDDIDALEDWSDRLGDLLDEKGQGLPEILGGFKCVSRTDDMIDIVMKVKASSVSSP